MLINNNSSRGHSGCCQLPIPAVEDAMCSNCITIQPLSITHTHTHCVSCKAISCILCIITVIMIIISEWEAPGRCHKPITHISPCLPNFDTVLTLRCKHSGCVCVSVCSPKCMRVLLYIPRPYWSRFFFKRSLLHSPLWMPSVSHERLWSRVQLCGWMVA